MLPLPLPLSCMWHVAVDTRNYCHRAWLFGSQYSVSSFQFLVSAVHWLAWALSFQFSVFNFLFIVSAFRGSGSLFVISESDKLHLYIIFHHLPCSCSRVLYNSQMKYFPNAIHFCANCFHCLSFWVPLRRSFAYSVGSPLASVWAFHLAKSYLKLVKRRQTEITHFGNWKPAKRQCNQNKFRPNYCVRPRILFDLVYTIWGFAKGDGCWK